MDQQDGSTEPQIPIRKILAIYFKASRKRVLSMLIISSIFFLLLTSIVIVSYSIYQDSFYSYIETNHNWLNDNEISVESHRSLEDPVTLATNHLMNRIEEVTTQLENMIPNILKKSAGVIEISLHNFISYNNYFGIFLSTYDNTALNLLTNNLHSGRLPENSTEILYYNALNQFSFEIGDVLNLTGQIVYNDYPEITKCQIVGIVNNLDSIFYNNNISTDILRETSNYFITTSNYFSNLVNEIDNKVHGVDVYIDFEYTFSVKHLKTNKYIKALNEYNWESMLFCEDLMYALNNFKMNWYLTIYNQLLICSPFMLLIGFISVEIYRTGNFEKRAKYRLLKTHGMDNQSLAKFLFYENLILFGSSLLIGLCLSLIVDYFVVRSLNLSPNVSYIAGFSNVSSIFMILGIFLGFFLINYLIDLLQLRKTKVTIMEEYETKKKRFLSKIFSLPELNFLVPGIILTIFGLLISYLAYAGGNYFESIINVNFFIGFSILAVLGILFLLLAVLLFLRRGMTYLWYRIGDSAWKNTKSYFSLALKHLSVYIRNYKNTIMVFFLIGLCVTPGLIIAKSTEEHNTLEANLSVGCSDILVENWNIDEGLESNISRIEGVELSTVLSNINLVVEDSSVFDDSQYIINFYVISNITEYVEIVNFTLLTQDGYSKNDITTLETDLTYLMNRKYARKNDYHKDEIFSNMKIFPTIFHPKELTYISDFSYFPLIPIRKFEGDFFYDLFNQPIYIDLVVSENTVDLILEHTVRERFQKDYLLIKTVEGANITAVQEALSSKYHLTAYTYEDYLTSIDSTLNSLGLNLFKIITILSIVLTVVYGCFKAANIYKERLRLLEIFVRNGAGRGLIVVNFSVEFILVILVPIIVSIGITIPYLNNVSSFMLNLVTEYTTFTLWFPWWVAILIGLLALFFVLIGWCTSLYLFVKTYRTHKSE
ncbi:MAG: hypothetical protein HGN29_17800 [Asgard group archaeon]|nr:hypothetical protein [Asgard group archaeon]